MKIIALYSIKGGVGKTASAVNLSYACAKAGFRTLLCDLDSQGSATFYFRIRPPKKFTAKKLLKGGSQIDKNIRGTDFENLDLLPADLSFRRFDLQLDDLKHSKRGLQFLFAPVADEYDFVFFDCPPNLTLLAENIFRAADLVAVPVIPTTLSILTYEKLLAFFKDQKLSRRKIKAFFSMVETRKALHKSTMAELKKDKRFLQTTIPYTSEIEKMGVHRMPVAAHDTGSSAGQVYRELWSELQATLT